MYNLKKSSKVISCILVVFLVFAFCFSYFKDFKNKNNVESTSTSSESQESSETAETEETEPSLGEKLLETTKNNTITFILLGACGITYVLLKRHELKKEQLLHEDSMIFTEVIDEEKDD